MRSPVLVGGLGRGRWMPAGIAARGCLLLFLTALPLAAGPRFVVDAAAQEVCEETTVTVPAEADAWVDENSPFSNNGSDSLIEVRSGVPAKNARGLVRFPLPAVPAGCVIEVAKLRLFSSSGSPDSRLEALQVAFGWSESLVTWSDQPATVGPPALTWAGEGHVQWTVTAQVKAMMDGANHGFLIRDETESSETGEEQSFHSREKGELENPPALVIRFDAPRPDGPPGPPEPPVPTAVTCGQELTRSVLLTNDLAECLGDGLVIGEDRIIVDLGGHTIDGIGLGTGVRNDGYDSVTVRNGTIKEFDHGVQLLPDSDLNVVEGLTLQLNQLTGVELSDAGAPEAGNEVRANTIEQNGDGIALLKGTTGAVVTGNTMSLNGGAGLRVRHSDGNRLEDNRVSGGGDLGVGLELAGGNVLRGNVVSGNSDGGIELLAGSHGNRIEQNTVLQSGDHGILVSESDRNELIGNSAQLMSDSGITLNLANDGVVSGNDVALNSGGLQLDSSSRNVLEANDASDTTGIGIELGGDSLANHLVRNIADGNGAQGISVSPDATLLAEDGTPLVGNLLERNEASGNAGDGIVTGKGGHTLTFNAAHDNDGWGINAAPGTIDGRGNVALGNHEAQQCIGIVCNADVTPPETSIGSGPPDPTASRTARLTFSGTDDRTAASALRFECRLDGEAFGPCSSPRDYVQLAEGAHTFEVRAIDLAGNADESPASYSWTVDVTAPETSIGDRPADPSSSRSASFAFAGSESGSRFECRLDDGEFADCASPKEYAELSDGSHTFEVRAIDGAGNVDASPASYSWVVDTVAPETSIGDRPADPTNSRSARFTFSADESGSRFECRLDNGEFADCSSPRDYEELAEGSHTFEVRAIDQAGNVDASPASYSWTIDVTAPETSIGDRPSDPSNSRSARFTFTADESGSRFECRLDDGEFADCASPKEYAELSDGSHTFEVRAIDQAGNVDASPASYSWGVDTVAPETSIGDRPSDPTNSRSARLSFAGEDDRTAAAGLRFECRLDGGEFADCSSPREYAELSDGSHTFEVRAIDRAGNVDQSPASYPWVVDTVAPETSIGHRPSDPSNSRLARFTFASSESGSRFECRLDDEAFADCSSPKDYTDLSEGGHTFEVRAIDRAGNVDASPASYSWTVDVTAPNTSIGDRPSDPSDSSVARFTFSASDSGSRFECSLDGGAFADCSSPKDYADLSDGAHTFEVRAIDRAGNVDQTPAGFSWTVDTTSEPPADTSPPETILGDRPADPTNSSSANFTFTGTDDRTAANALRFQCRLDSSSFGFTDCSSPRLYTGLTAGAHQFEVRAVDEAGNVDETPATHSWTIDTVAPQTTLGPGAPPAMSSSTSATFAFSSNETGSTFECSLDNAAFGSCTSPRVHNNLSGGAHQFRVRARDAAGNVDQTPATHAWTVDTSVPQTTLNGGPTGTTTNTGASFTFSSNESGASFQCRLDSEAFAACTTPKVYTGLAAGSHTFQVRAVDQAGNTDATPASRTWTIQAGGPAPGCGTSTAASAADGWVLQSSPTTNYSTDSVLKVDSKSGGNARALVRFNLPAIPAGCRVTSARLRLYAGSYKTGRTLQALRVAAPWTEQGVTWNNQPATTGAAATVASGSGYREWTVTAQVDSMYAEGNNGFLIRDSAENGGGVEQGFNSREKGSDNPPALVITFGN